MTMVKNRMPEIERRMRREKQKRKKDVTKVNVQAGPTRDAYRKMKLSGCAWTPKHGSAVANSAGKDGRLALIAGSVAFVFDAKTANNIGTSSSPS